MTIQRPRTCLACGHLTMGAGKASMQCTHCKAWDWPNMDPEAERFVRRLDLRARQKQAMRERRKGPRPGGVSEAAS